jgi:hypothetical protein
MTTQDAWRLGVKDCHANRYPLYSTLLIAEKLTLAETYRRAWRSVNGQDLVTFRDRGSQLPPSSDRTR